MELPQLPPHELIPWSSAILRAHQAVQDTCIGAAVILRQEDSDPVRLKTWADKVEQHMGLVEAIGNEGVPDEWVAEAVDVIRSLAAALREAQSAVEGR